MAVNMVKLTIDGKEVEAHEGANLLEAAEMAGIHIPNLCYLKGMKPIGACRLCLVEVEGVKAPLIACNAKVKDGMKVNTKTEKILEARRFVIDLILSMHPLDCMTCTKAGVCRLQSYAYDFEIKESSFTRKKFGYPIDEANPFIKRDSEYCILCGKCVRVCKEQGTNVLEFMGRGVGAKVATANDKPLQESECTFCGSCVDACPVNALLEADRWRKGREWEYEKIGSVCLLCGNACEISVSTKDGKIQKINAGGQDGSVEKYICAYGRFGFDSLDADTRLTSPLKKTGSGLKETTWEDALNIIAGKLKAVKGEAGFISTASILNEDAITLKRLADSLKTKNIDTTLSLYADTDSLKSGHKADIMSGDLIVLVGINPSQWERVLPCLDASIRRMVDRGSRLIVINSSDTKMAGAAALNLKGDESALLKAMINSLIRKGMKADRALEAIVKDANVSENIEKAAAMYLEAKNPLIFSCPAFFKAASNLSLMKGSVVAVPLESNAKGISVLGLSGSGKTYKEMASKDSTALLYVVGEVPLKKRPKTDFLVVQGSHLTGLAKQADIVLPSAAFLESAGTIMDYMGRLKYLPQVVEPQEGSKTHSEIFIRLSKAMGKPIKRPTEAEVKKALKSKTRLLSGEFKKTQGIDVEAGEIIESLNASVIGSSRLAWLKGAKNLSYV